MKTTTAGLSILAGGLAFAGSIGATDLISNGSFEEGPGIGWVGDFGIYNFSAAYYAGPPIPLSENPGSVYSWRHGLSASDFSGPLVQTVGLAAGAADEDIDAGHGIFTFSAWLASYTQNPERPLVTLQFLDAANNPLSGVIALDRTSGVNFTGFADGVTTFDRTTHEHYWAKYVSAGSVPPGARSARVGVGRSPNAGLAGRPDTYTDLVKLDVSTEAAVPPSFVSASPSGPNARPDVVVAVAMRDGTTQVDPAQIQMTFDGTVVTPQVQRNGVNTLITYDPPGLLESESTHAVRVLAADNAAQRTRLTNDFSFAVLHYQNIVLPAPLYLETFDTTEEGALPAGWSGVSYTEAPDANIDLGDLNSAVYANWTVVDSARFNGTFLSYNNHVPTDDYQRVLSVNPVNVVNGAVVENLAQGRFCFADSGYRDGRSQVEYLYSPDFDLRGQAGVSLVFHSLWEQNQDSIASVEYSVDEGATWLPLLYLLDQAAVERDAGGNIDAVATLGTVRGEIATYVDPADQSEKGGYYGAFLGVTSDHWSELGPYISPRVNDDPVESKRVEVLALPAADNQAKVRLRFAHAGTDSWYFGIDNVGLYASNTPPLADASATETTVISANYSNAVVHLDGSRSSDPDNDPLTFAWFVDGGQVPVATEAVASTVLELGVHQVVLVVNDGSATGSVPIEIHVVTSGEAIDAMITLINQAAIPRQVQRPLIATLKAAIASFDRGSNESGVNQLHAFQNKVLAQLAGVAPELAAQLLADAQKIIDAVAEE